MGSRHIELTEVSDDPVLVTVCLSMNVCIVVSGRRLSFVPCDSFRFYLNHSDFCPEI